MSEPDRTSHILELVINQIEGGIDEAQADLDRIEPRTVAHDIQIHEIQKRKKFLERLLGIALGEGVECNGNKPLEVLCKRKPMAS